MELFPMFLKLQGRPCLVVGAGTVAESKIESLLRCGASVRVVAPAANQVVRGWAAAGTIEWEQRAFSPSDLAGMFLVVAATSSPELHEEIFRRAQREGILCNAVDEPERCDFYYPAIVRRGPLQIAISTGGNAPSLAQRLRQELEHDFGPEYGPWTEEIGRARSELFSRDIPAGERRERLHELSSDQAFREFCNRQKASLDGIENASKSGKVFFVGAGPGDPDLLTRKAWNILRTAEVVLHDALVPPEIVRLAPVGVTICNVGKRCGRKSVTQEEIHAQLIEHASAGRVVVRLQGGDPLIFGRAGEEISALREAGIAYEIVPGVTAASAAAAAAGISLTDRRLASKVIFLSGHRRAGGSETEWGPLPAADATLAVFMPGSDYERVSRQLIVAGLEAETPCLVISQASMPEQQILRTDLVSLADVPPLPAPALLIVGGAAAADSMKQRESSCLAAP